MKVIEIQPGTRYGNLTIISEAPRRNPTRRYVLCRCDCGQLTEPALAAIRNGNTTSCGCVHRANTGNLKRRHNLRRTPEYQTWAGMTQRCLNPNNPQFHNYGGRGIKVCERWLDFQAFYNDMGVRPSASSEIDRIDNNGDYCPENCKWVDHKTNSNNRRTNVVLELNGVKKNVTEWADHLGLTQSAVYARLKRGWSVERTLTTPLKGSK